MDHSIDLSKQYKQILEERNHQSYQLREISSQPIQYKLIGNQNTITIPGEADQIVIRLLGKQNKLTIADKRFIYLQIVGNGNIIKLKNCQVYILIRGNCNQIIAQQTQYMKGQLSKNQLKINQINQEIKDGNHGNQLNKNRFYMYKSIGFDNKSSPAVKQIKQDEIYYKIFQRKPKEIENKSNYIRHNYPEGIYHLTQSQMQKQMKEMEQNKKKMKQQRKRQEQRMHRQQYTYIDNGNDTSLISDPYRQFPQHPFKRKLRAMKMQNYKQGKTKDSTFIQSQQQIQNRQQYIRQQNLARRAQQNNFDNSADAYRNRVGLNNEQIQKIPIMKFSGEPIQCAICLQLFNLGQEVSYLFCFHTLHTNCAQDWFKKSLKCPLCNLDLRKQIVRQQKQEQQKQQQKKKQQQKVQVEEKHEKFEKKSEQSDQ